MPSEQHFYGCKSTIFSLSHLKLGYLSFLIHPEIPTYSDAAAPFLHLSVSISHLLSSPTRADVGGHRPRCGETIGGREGRHAQANCMPFRWSDARECVTLPYCRTLLSRCSELIGTIFVSIFRQFVFERKECSGLHN